MPIMGIKDLSTSENIKFIGGKKGTNELKRLVDGGMACAFVLYPC